LLKAYAWDINNFVTLSRYHEDGTVTFGDDSKGKFIDIGNIKIGSSFLIENVILVDGLKHNLLSISQLCDRGFNVIFDDLTCNVLDRQTNACVLFSFHENNMYMIDMSNLLCNATCLNAFNKDSWLWHRRLGHVSFDYLSRINNKEVVKSIPYLKFEKDHICDACQLGKQTKYFFKIIKDIMTSRLLKSIHMDLFGPTKTKCLSGNHFVFVLVDNFSRFIWVFFLEHKDQAFSHF